MSPSCRPRRQRQPCFRLRVLVVLATVLLSAGGEEAIADSRAASGPAARAALLDGNVALAASPPNREAARGAFAKAVAANDDGMAVAEALMRLGVLDEDDGDFADALAHHQACVAKAPSSRWARNAGKRIAWLHARSEGGFAPLARLHRAQRESAQLNEVRAVEELASGVEAFPAGTVRAEARMLIADAWLRRLGRPADAAAVFRQVANDPTSDPVSARFAIRGLVEALLSAGRLDDAVAALGRPSVPPDLAARVRRAAHQRLLMRAGAAATVALLVSGSIWMMRRRRRAQRVLSA